MASFNKVILMGNLTRDPELKYLPSQTAVATFALAMNNAYLTREGEKREDVCFVECAAFGKTAETINQYFTKGKPIHVEGALKFESWEDKNGGGKRQKLSVRVERFTFCGGKSEGDDSDQRRPAANSAGRTGSRPPTRPPASRPPANEYPPYDEEGVIDGADIPF